MSLIKIVIVIISVIFNFSLQAASVWKVSNDQYSIYIGGTIHILSDKDYPLASEYDAAFEASDKLIFETDMATVSSPEFGQRMLSQMLYKDGTTINTVLQPDTYQALAIHLSSRNIPMQAFASYKPNLLSISLTLIELQEMGYTSEGVDMFFSKKATTQGKSQGWLESPEEQINFLSKMGKEDPSSLIEYTLNEIKIMPETFKKLHSAWFAGDMEAMAEVGITPFKLAYPAFYNDILVTRNNNWMPQIIKMLSDKPTEFVLVGALHLSGPDSILSQLKSKGYTIQKL